MAEQIELLRKKFEDSILQVKDASELETLRVNFLGKSGFVTTLLKGMGKLSPDEKKKMGQAVNTFKQSVVEAISKKIIKKNSKAGFALNFFNKIIISKAPLPYIGNHGPCRTPLFTNSPSEIK